jgi:hypothetical protein
MLSITRCARIRTRRSPSPDAHAFGVALLERRCARIRTRCSPSADANAFESLFSPMRTHSHSMLSVSRRERIWSRPSRSPIRTHSHSIFSITRCVRIWSRSSRRCARICTQCSPSLDAHASGVAPLDRRCARICTRCTPSDDANAFGVALLERRRERIWSRPSRTSMRTHLHSTLSIRCARICTRPFRARPRHSDTSAIATDLALTALSNLLQPDEQIANIGLQGKENAPITHYIHVIFGLSCGAHRSCFDCRIGGA